MKILVTGGTGFAGSHLIAELLKQGYTDIYSTTFNTASSSETHQLSLDRYIQVNLVDTQATASMIQTLKPDWIFQLASFAYVGKSFDNATQLFQNNINLQLSMLEAVRLFSPESRILAIGSAEEYGVTDPKLYPTINEACPLNPVNPYGVSKTAQDLLANSYFLSYKLNIVRVRPFNHIGTNQTVDFAIPSFAKQIADIEKGKQEKLLVGNLDGVRDFTDVNDMVKAYILLMLKGNRGDVYNVGSSKGWVMKDIVSMLSSLSTASIQIEQDPTRFRPLEIPPLIADNTKMVSLGWQPTLEIKPILLEVLQEWRGKNN